MLSPEAKIKVQNFGRFLSNMVMPNIGAFIAWGFITALFIPTGWIPNETLAAMVGPMITYLLPLLIGYTGGKMVGGDRGAVVGAITTMGVIVGTDIPMFMGAMIVGPLGGLAIKKFDAAVHGKVKSGFEMLVNNFSAGIVGMICAILAFLVVGPAVKLLSSALAAGVDVMVNAGLLPLASIFVEPAKILFLNNAINHGIFTPLGVQQSEELGRSIFFLIEANPGPGLGLLLAYMVFGKGNAKQSAAGASIIHFFGGIHEIYFPYVLMNPRLILAVIAGGMTGVFTNVVFSSGLISPASPGSIFAVLIMTPKDSFIGVILSVVAAAAVSFLVASLLMKTQAQADDEEDSLEKAASQMKDMKASSKGQAANADVNMSAVKNIIVACDAGMGSSAMGAGLLRKKVEAAGLDISVTNLAINNLPQDVDIVVTHKDLTDRARSVVDSAYHISLSNFLDGAVYDNLVAQLLEAQGASEAPAVAKEETEQQGTLKLSNDNIFLGMQAKTKEEVIKFAGEQLVKLGNVRPEYVDGMLAREELVSTYLGESIAVPHGTIEAKQYVESTGIVFCQFPEGIQWGEDEDDVAKMVIGIAAQGDEHIQVITAITNSLDDEEAVEVLKTTSNPQDVLNILNGK
ncbi:PTS mannitol transporter subunit IICBA [Vibrio breoganii]|uniref:PTS system mannitol-specific EIICBA component n=1 Tax=Vibrio breoganii TaxID=553239 RepID=A0AAP8MYG5_9VIBR|nr:PTS mannitol transporter subunit IICBA [Vibrio breoganii]PMH17780.1 PTS mannitol transporter subunit IICBA [Vibrio breoganii]PMK52294.1 PTS mannitol transporter subunit IICBA [Vibrio breoganii]PMM18937.1 PTS mannitol transporter subunit IICBA [Vibrio breoganii]PMP09803.1 PTS mannitol transporter subunit IICBA [Vibrio breoganii]PMP11775.1 PTS mannitol transporter subunit IICBA [Vibrio breoganii]